MMETEAVVAQGALKAVCSRDELTRALGIVSRGVSTRTTVQILAGILLEAVDGKLDLAATDMELSLRTSLEAQVETEGSVVVPGRLLLELARLLPDAEVTLEHKRRGGRGRDPLRHGDLPSAHLQRRGLPAAAGGRGGRAPRDRARELARDGGAGQPLRVARRVAPGADRCPDALRAGKARDGRDRLLPALGQGDAARRDGAGARGDRAGARARGARPDRAGRRDDRARRAREPGRLRNRRRAG